MKTEADEALWFVMPTAAGFRWRIVLVHHDHEMLHDFDDETPDAPPLHALSITPERVIYLNASLAMETIYLSLHHEMCHSWFHDNLSSRLLNSKVAGDMEELVTVHLSPFLCMVAPPRWPALPPEAVALRREARRRRRRAA